MSEEINDQVLSIVANFKKTQHSNAETTPAEEYKVTGSHPVNVKKTEQIKGKPKSGRFWKAGRERFSSINKTKGLRQDFKKKTALRLELKRTKELSAQVQEQLKQKELVRKERRRENIKRTEENIRKGEVVQVITNTTKLKRMKKKQLRFIQKRDTNKVESNK